MLLRAAVVFAASDQANNGDRVARIALTRPCAVRPSSERHGKGIFEFVRTVIWIGTSTVTSLLNQNEQESIVRSVPAF
jgi:hypothetical protein